MYIYLIYTRTLTWTHMYVLLNDHESPYIFCICVCSLYSFVRYLLSICACAWPPVGAGEPRQARSLASGTWSTEGKARLARVTPITIQFSEVSSGVRGGPLRRAVTQLNELPLLFSLGGDGSALLSGAGGQHGQRPCAGGTYLRNTWKKALAARR